MRHVVAGLVVLVTICSAPVFSQFDTRRMETIEEQSLLRQGRAFAVGVGARLPVVIVGIEELRRPDGRARFAVVVKNVSGDAVPSYGVSAAVVGNDGKVKAWQPLDPVKQLKPGQSRRQEITVRVAVPALTDYIAFAVAELEPPSGDAWKASQPDLEQAIQKVSARFAR
jgi:hypothetical protein